MKYLVGQRLKTWNKHHLKALNGLLTQVMAQVGEYEGDLCLNTVHVQGFDRNAGNDSNQDFFSSFFYIIQLSQHSFGEFVYPGIF